MNYSYLLQLQQSAFQKHGQLKFLLHSFDALPFYCLQSVSAGSSDFVTTTSNSTFHSQLSDYSSFQMRNKLAELRISVTEVDLEVSDSDFALPVQWANLLPEPL
ncbi:Hypothetical_protein [Hexamita inflata]|uniref:Hypothetical_protein n=1 Tax=Hexamita inflata TaxID=28002 RepID=A0AA86NMK9_9EUKA|nr:Hypothetical protein HINF_LOCUS10707 [Hexamita inflata]